VRDLRAITLAHINRSLIANGQGGISVLLSQNVNDAATKFATTIAPQEREALIKFIEQR
jgi:hypothetical protein